MNKLIIPKKLDPIVRAFFAESPQMAKKLLIQAAKAIYGSDDDKDSFDFPRNHHQITKEELEEICTLMQGIKPKDMIEAMMASQIVVSHMLGMRKLAKGYLADQHIGLKMFRFSMDAIQQLQKKRSGSVQNITVNYNYNGSQAAPNSSVPIEICG